jgi:hypothetical protein
MSDVGLVALRAPDPVELVNAARPLDLLVVVVTLQADAVLVPDGCPGILAEVQYRRPCLSSSHPPCVLGSRAMARLALVLSERCPLVRGYRVSGAKAKDGEDGEFAILPVTLDASIRTLVGEVALLDSPHRRLCLVGRPPDLRHCIRILVCRQQEQW